MKKLSILILCSVFSLINLTNTANSHSPYEPIFGSEAYCDGVSDSGWILMPWSCWGESAGSPPLVMIAPEIIAAAPARRPLIP
jgi:hypothetical protein